MPSTTVAESRSYSLEDTPDFYIRKQSPIVYLTIGEVERIRFGSAAYHWYTRYAVEEERTTKMSAVLVKSNFHCYEISRNSWGEGGYGSASFKSSAQLAAVAPLHSAFNFQSSLLLPCSK